MEAQSLGDIDDPLIFFHCFGVAHHQRLGLFWCFVCQRPEIKIDFMLEADQQFGVIGFGGQNQAIFVGQPREVNFLYAIICTCVMLVILASKKQTRDFSPY
jgi:hypothetical protein